MLPDFLERLAQVTEQRRPSNGGQVDLDIRNTGDYSSSQFDTHAFPPLKSARPRRPVSYVVI
jgi:hypothetical protein